MSPRADGPAPAGGADPEEIELKLAVADPGVVRALLRRPPAEGIAGFVPAGPIRTVIVVDRYFDTADGALTLGGVRARVRDQGGERILAVKASIATEGAVSRRVELQGPAAGGLQPATWPASNARDRLLPLIGDRDVVEIAAIRQRRLQRDFAAAGTRVEISLDEMTALDGRRALAHRTEVEAELLAGDAGLLQELAAALGELAGVGVAAGSKLAFALAARAAVHLAPAGAKMRGSP
jgi:inorganic triphosphatase YgiF